MPSGSAGLLSAQIARSSPLSATARAWATWSWLLASRGSEAASIEKAMISADRINSVIRAMGSAMPRWHQRIVRTREKRMEPPLHVAKPDDGLDRGLLIGRGVGCDALFGAGHELYPDEPDVGRCPRRGAGVRGAVESREVGHGEGLHAADERGGDAARDAVDRGPGEPVLDCGAG